MRVLFTNATQRKEEQRRRLEQFVAIQQSEDPPLELQQPCPRKIRWSPLAKRLLVVEMFFPIALLLAFGIWFVPKAAREHQKLRHVQEQLRHETEDAKNAEQRKDLRVRAQILQQREQNLSMIELDVVRQTLALFAAWVLYMGLSWFAFIRPFGVLLRKGMYSRGLVTGRKQKDRRWWIIEYEFMSETGANIRGSWATSKAVQDIVKDGQQVWLVYLPGKSKRAIIYGLNAFAEVVAAQSLAI